MPRPFQALRELHGQPAGRPGFHPDQRRCRPAAGLIAKLVALSGVRCVPMAQVVLRKPACHSTARSNRPSTRITAGKWRTDSQANRPPLERGSNRWGKAVADTAAIEIDDLALLAAGEDHSPAEGVAALVVDQADVEQQIERIAWVGEMTSQISAGSVADAQFLDEVGSRSPRCSR